MNANKAKEDKWIEVIPRHRERAKQIATSKELRKRQVETESRYHVLQNLQETNGITESLEMKKTRGIANPNVRTQIKKKHKAILIGDSHARGCAEKLSSYLGNAYEVRGYVSPNTGLDVLVITNSAKEETEQLTQKDIVIVCGGTNNISKNESNKGLRHVTHFVQNKRNTNVIILGAPHRFDLEESSCVNKEVKVFNKTLNKIMKRYNHIKVIDMSAKRDLYTQQFLRIYIMETLNWNIHLQSLAHKLSKVSFMIKTLKETLSPYMIIHIYFTKFHAILRSGTLLSGRGIKGDLSIRVFKIQKRVVRLLAGVSFRTSCRQLFKKLNILTMASLCILEVTCFIRKNCKFLEQNSQVHQHDTRRKLDIHVNTL